MKCSVGKNVLFASSLSLRPTIFFFSAGCRSVCLNQSRISRKKRKRKKRKELVALLAASPQSSD